MKVLIVVELDMPRGGTLKEMTAAFDAVKEIPGNVDSRLIAHKDQVEYIGTIAREWGGHGPQYSRRKKLK